MSDIGKEADTASLSAGRSLAHPRSRRRYILFWVPVALTVAIILAAALAGDNSRNSPRGWPQTARSLRPSRFLGSVWCLHSHHHLPGNREPRGNGIYRSSGKHGPNIRLDGHFDHLELLRADLLPF